MFWMLVIIMAGIMTGSFGLPMKYRTRWKAVFSVIDIAARPAVVFHHGQEGTFIGRSGHSPHRAKGISYKFCTFSAGHGPGLKDMIGTFWEGIS
jgi:hypothetical protein